MEHKENGQLTLVNEKLIINIEDKTFQLDVYGNWREPWFIANEVGKMIGLKNIHNNLQDVDEDEKAALFLKYGRSGSKKTTLISEDGFYEVIMGLRNNSFAKKFKKMIKIMLKEKRLSLNNPNNNNQLLIESREQIERLTNENQRLTTEIIEVKENLNVWERNGRIFRNQEDGDLALVSRLATLCQDFHIHGFSIRFYQFLTTPEQATNNEGITKWYDRPEKKFLDRRLRGLSMRITKMYKLKRNTKPPKDNRYTRNIYKLDDYREFGDSVILRFLYESRPMTWNLGYQQANHHNFTYMSNEEFRYKYRHLRNDPSFLFFYNEMEEDEYY